MKILLISGLLYLLGIAIVLFFRPAIMFNSKGEWKEFGIGRDKDKFTPFPFWLFVFVWAIFSYIMVRLLFKIINGFNSSIENTIINVNKKNRIQYNTEINTDVVQEQQKLMPGFYILNTASAKKGVPKYVYYGTQPPLE